MLDKLSLSSPSKMTIKEASTLLKGLYEHSTLTATKFHQEVVEFKNSAEKGGMHLAVHTNPRYSNISPLKVVLNPSHFRNFRNMSELLSRFTDLENLRVNRIDHAVDMQEITVQQIHSSLILSRKKSREVYRDGLNLESFYIGRSPEVLVVYNKSLLEGAVDQRSRIELQQWREKVPIREYKHLADYQSFSPFSNLQFKKLIQTESLSNKDAEKVLKLGQFLNSTGAQGTLKALNRHSNFKRDVGHLFERDNSIPDLDELYRANLRTYFSEELQ